MGKLSSWPDDGYLAESVGVPSKVLFFPLRPQHLLTAETLKKFDKQRILMTAASGNEHDVLELRCHVTNGNFLLRCLGREKLPHITVILPRYTAL